MQRVFHFGKGKNEGNKAMKDLVSSTDEHRSFVYYCVFLISF